MSRAIPLALLLGAAIVGCGTRGGDAPQPGAVDTLLWGGVPPTPNQQQRVEFIHTNIGRISIGGLDAGDPDNGVLGPIHQLSQTVTDADILAIRDPGFAFGLRLTSPKLTDEAIAACANLPSLMYFGVHKARAVTAAGVAELARLKHLRVLELTDLGADDTWLAALKPLTELRKLNLDGCYRVTDAGLVHLSGMTHLRVLALHSTKVTGSGLGALASAKGLHRVVLPQQTDAALQALAKIGKLHALEEALTAAEERPTTNADVTRFMIRGPVTDVGLKEVRAFPNMTHLYIQSEKVTAASLPFLKSLKKLKRLDPDFPITDEQRAELTKALPGCEIR